MINMCLNAYIIVMIETICEILATLFHVLILILVSKINYLELEHEIASQ